MVVKTYVYGVYVSYTDGASATAHVPAAMADILKLLWLQRRVYGVYVPYKDGVSATAHVSAAMEDILHM